MPTSPVEFFQELERDCAVHLALTWRGREDHPPPVEPDRFAAAVLLRDLGNHSALVRDGRGTPLVIRDWQSYGRVLPESGREQDPMAEPYASACPPEVFLGTR